jgi:5-hydroxyisourate hydrolase
MPGISIHVVDVSRGVVATGMRVVLSGADGTIVDGNVGKTGTLDDPALSRAFAIGRYRAAFHLGAYYRAEGVALPAEPFLDIVTYDFGIADPAQHYHLPFKCTPWGYSCFRGGA